MGRLVFMSRMGMPGCRRPYHKGSSEQGDQNQLQPADHSGSLSMERMRRRYMIACLV